jgi:hypothetical protein
MASMESRSYVVILFFVGSVSTCHAQFAMQREAQFGTVLFPTDRILPNERHVAAQGLSRETNMPFSSDDLHLVRDEVVWITLTGGKKHHISVFSASTPSQVIVSDLHTAAKIEKSIDTVATQLADRYVVRAFVSISGRYHAYSDW